MNGKWTGIVWDDAMLAAARKGLVEIGIIVTDQAVSICPTGRYPGTGRIGGRLKGSITYATSSMRTLANNPKVSQHGDEVSAPSDDYTLHIGTNVEYAPYVEYGTVKWPTGQPYLRVSMDIKRDEACKRYAEAISKELQSRVK
jgi:hypothetical protein